MSSPSTDEKTIERLYRRRFPEADRAAKARIWKVLVERWFQRWIDPEDTVVDLGCGFGEFLNHVRSTRRIGIDLSPESEALLADGVEFHRGRVSQLGFLEDESVDLVFTSNVLEHLDGKAEVDATLAEAWRVLRPGGSFVALGPNLRFLNGSYWDFWDHFVPITDRSLVEALETTGFEVVESIPRFLPYTTRSRLPQAPWMVALYLAFPPIWRLLGGQFLVRARRPSIAPR